MICGKLKLKNKQWKIDHFLILLLLHLGSTVINSELESVNSESNNPKNQQNTNTQVIDLKRTKHQESGGVIIQKNFKGQKIALVVRHLYSKIDNENDKKIYVQPLVNLSNPKVTLYNHLLEVCKTNNSPERMRH